MNDDLISRQAVLDAFDCSVGGVPVEAVKYVVEYADKMMSRINALPSVEPEIPSYVAEIEAEYAKWINVPYIRKPLAKALYEVWKKHDREDAERRTDG